MSLELAGLDHRTLVVWASDDPSGPAATGVHIADVLPNGRFELISGAGHWPRWEQSDKFNHLVTTYLTEE